jgi:carboxylate-amine ligase
MKYGTLEVRVADTQVSSRDSAGVAAFVHCLTAWLAARHDAGEPLPVHETWRIAENRWSACSDGIHGRMADLVTGATEPTGDRLERLIDAMAPTAAQLGCARELELARDLSRDNGATRQRRIAEAEGVSSMVRWLAEEFALAGGSSGFRDWSRPAREDVRR